MPVGGRTGPVAGLSLTSKRTAKNKLYYTICRPVLRADGRWYTRFIGPKVSKYVWYQASIRADTPFEAIPYFARWVKETDKYIDKSQKPVD